MSEMNENIDFLTFPTYQARMSLFKELPASKGSIVFVGDSLTHRNEWSESFPGLEIINRGIDSDRSVGVVKRFDQIIALEPSKIFLMIGVNDVYDYRDLDVIESNIERIIDRVKTELPDTKLYVQSILPVNNSVFKHRLDNKLVTKMNDKLVKLTTEKEIAFINLYPQFIKNDELDEIYTMDGCHLSGKGYKNWVENIRSYVVE